MEKRQNKIRPLLPIDGYHFKIQDYTSATINTRNKLSEYLYNKAKHKLNTDNKLFIREAHEDFKYLQSINPNYKDVPNLINLSHQKGTDYVFVQLKNNTQHVIPKRLENNLLDIKQYHLNNYWVVHHSKKLPKTKYNYHLTLSFEDIKVSPERIREIFITEEKKIKDGQKYVLDENGNVKKDENGNDIKVDKYVNVKSIIHQFTQNKECQIMAKANVIDNNTQQTIYSTPLRSNFVFEHIYATYNGDKRALTRHYLALLLVRQIPFPSNTQMILDAGSDIKNQLKKQLTRSKF